MSDRVTNVVVAGLGGQGVLKASDIVAEAAFRAGRDVKKSEIHGMSQRGGSVTSDVRFGTQVLSPMVPGGEAHYLLVLAPDQIENNRARLRPDGVLVEPSVLDTDRLPHPRSLNVALLGVLSTHLDFELEHWQAAIQSNLPQKVHELNAVAFEMGRQAARSTP
ncbi:MAG: 2-oxoacid:acceptor oxidoreductase family protein [Candidatus Brocadiia bacterium]